MIKAFKIVTSIILTIAVIIGYFFFFQESIIFIFPQKLPSNYEYEFQQNFEEINIKTNDNINLNGVLFKTDSSSKGLIFYLHGNARNVISWSSIVPFYNKLNYDIFILDYRGYGKSEGKIESEAQFYNDVQTAYNELKSRYNESKITIIGYSIGTGSAAMLAANNNPKMLVLQAPYYNLTQIMEYKYPFLPSFLLEYKFETNKFVEKTKAPIVIFHGNNDKVIPIESGLQLKKHFKPTDQFIILDTDKYGHHGLNHNKQFQKAIKEILQ